MRNLTEKQNKVIEAAKLELKKEKWFRGVCVDNVPSDREIDRNFQEAVNSVYIETAIWDDPDFFSGQ